MVGKSSRIRVSFIVKQTMYLAQAAALTSRRLASGSRRFVFSSGVSVDAVSSAIIDAAGRPAFMRSFFTAGRYFASSSGKKGMSIDEASSAVLAASGRSASNHFLRFLSTEGQSETENNVHASSSSGVDGTLPVSETETNVHASSSSGVDGTLPVSETKTSVHSSPASSGVAGVSGTLPVGSGDKLTAGLQDLFETIRSKPLVWDILHEDIQKFVNLIEKLLLEIQKIQKAEGGSAGGFSFRWKLRLFLLMQLFTVQGASLLYTWLKDLLSDKKAPDVAAEFVDLYKKLEAMLSTVHKNVLDIKSILQPDVSQDDMAATLWSIVDLYSKMIVLLADYDKLEARQYMLKNAFDSGVKALEQPSWFSTADM